MIPLYYAAPLGCAVIYALGAILSKRASQEGFGVGRTLFVYNWIMALMFLPLLALPHEAPDWGQWVWPVFAGLLFFLGQFTTFAAIRAGDVSVQAPVMGCKVIFVAAFTVWLGAGHVPWTWWTGAILTAVAVYLLGGGIRKKPGVRSMWLAITLAIMSAISFGLCDVIVQMKAKAFGPVPFAVLMMFVMALPSVIVVPFFKEGFGSIPRQAWPWAIGGALALGTQCIALYLTLCFFGRATGVNIMYSSRGLWSILLIWLAGHWFGNTEKATAGTAIMAKRLAGCCLIFVAICLVLVYEPEG